MPLSLSGSLLITGSIVTPSNTIQGFTSSFGSELLSNPTFSGSATGWYLGSDVVYYNNSLSCSYDGTGEPIASASFSVVEGVEYFVNFVLSDVLNDDVASYTNINGGYINQVGNGTWEYSFVSNFTGTDEVVFDLWNYNPGASYILEEVSVRALNILPVSFTGPVNFSSGSVTLTGGSLTVSGSISSTSPIGILAKTGSAIFLVDPYVSNFNTTNSIVLGVGAGLNTPNSPDSIFIGSNVCSNVDYSQKSVVIGNQASVGGTNMEYNAIVGYEAGSSGDGVDGVLYNNSILGYRAGFKSRNAQQCTMIGTSAGSSVNSPLSSVFVGSFAGFESNFDYSSDKSNSIFIGLFAGSNSPKLKQGVIIGDSAGQNSTLSSGSVFLGYEAGRYAPSASDSIIIGKRAGRTENLTAGPSRNNIIIGTAVTLEEGRQDSINIGAIIFGTGSYYSNENANAYSGSVNGKIGINKSVPQYSLDVSGSIGLTDLFVLASKDTLPVSNVPSGSIMASGSNADFKPYFWNGATWTSLI